MCYRSWCTAARAHAAPSVGLTAVQCGCAMRLPGDPDNEHLYTNVDQFHMQKDKIAFDGGGSDSDDSVRPRLSCMGWVGPSVAPLGSVRSERALVEPKCSYTPTHDIESVLLLRAGSSIYPQISSVTNAACISNSNVTYLVSC